MNTTGSIAQGGTRQGRCMGKRIVPLVLLLAIPGAHAQPAKQMDPCSASSSVPDVTFSLAIKGDRSEFQQGEIIPLILTFTSSAGNRYWADVRNYDRSGRLGIESYCLEPEAPDPLESYFRAGTFMGGGLGSQQELSGKPFTAAADLNEWRSPAPGHYRLYAVSYRVWRPPDPGENPPWGRVDVVLRSSEIQFDVLPANPEWQSQQLQEALRSIQNPATNADAVHAARVLRFLNTKDSTRALAHEFWGLNDQQPIGWDLMLGLFGSPFPHLAIDAMQKEITAPGHAITQDFLFALTRLRINNDPAWTLPAGRSAEEARSFWTRHQAHEQELLHEETRQALAALPRKTGTAKARTVAGLITVPGDDAAVRDTLRPQLIAAWNDLPTDTRQDLIQNRWGAIAGPAMLPILQKIADEPPPPSRTMAAFTRDAALKHIVELDKKDGIARIRRDLLNPNANPPMDLIQMLPPDDIAAALPAAVARIVHGDSRETDFALIDRFGDAASLAAVQTVFESQLGQWACDPQSHMLRYFLRVAPAYGVREVEASLQARQSTGCYRLLLQELGAELPQAEPVALDALNDPDLEVAADAALALGHWGTARAEPALWARMEKFNAD